MSLSVLPNARLPKAREYTYPELRAEVESSISEIRDGFRENKTKIEDLTEKINEVKNRTCLDKILIGMTGVAFIIIGIALTTLCILFEGYVLSYARIVVCPVPFIGIYSCCYGIWLLGNELIPVSFLEHKLELLKTTEEHFQNHSIPRLKAKLENAIEKIAVSIAALEENNKYYHKKSLEDPRLTDPLISFEIANSVKSERLKALKISASNGIEELS